jgi:hypothetical protein
MPMPFGLVEDPIDDKERAKVAGTCVDDLDLPMPALIDGVDDKVGRGYGGWPDRLYVIGKDGKVAFAGAQGPGGFDPEAWEKAIVAEKARIAEAAKAGAEKKAPDEKPVGPKR